MEPMGTTGKRKVILVIVFAAMAILLVIVFVRKFRQSND